MSCLRFVLRWLPSLVLMALIFTLSSIPGSRLPFFGEYDLIVKKGGHALGYALLAAAYAHAMPSRLSYPYRAAVSFLMALLFALSDEFHQSFVEGRHSTLADVGIDSVGAALGLLLRGIYSSNSNSKSSG